MASKLSFRHSKEIEPKLYEFIIFEHIRRKTSAVDTSGKRHVWPRTHRLAENTSSGREHIVWPRTHRAKDTSGREHIGQKTRLAENTSGKRHVWPRTHRAKDTSGKRHISQKTHQAKDTSGRGHIGQKTRLAENTSSGREHIVWPRTHRPAENTSGKRHVWPRTHRLAENTSSGREHIVRPRTHRAKDTSCKRHIVQKTHRTKDISCKRHIGQKTHRAKDTSGKRHIVQKTHLAVGTSVCFYEGRAPDAPISELSLEWSNKCSGQIQVYCPSLSRSHCCSVAACLTCKGSLSSHRKVAACSDAYWASRKCAAVLLPERNEHRHDCHSASAFVF